MDLFEFVADYSMRQLPSNGNVTPKLHEFREWNCSYRDTVFERRVEVFAGVEAES